MTEDAYRCADVALKVAGGLVAFGGAIVAYRGLRIQITKNREERQEATHQRAEDLNWRRAEFIIRLWKEINGDKSLRPGIVLLDRRDEGALKRILLSSVSD